MNFQTVALLAYVSLTVLNLYACFFPYSYLDNLLSLIDASFKFDLGETSKTLTHEDILKQGLVRSVTKYFYEQKPDGLNKINLSKANKEYLDLKNLYHDFYGKRYCDINLEDIIKNDLFPNVAIVDLDLKTRKLPFAHFDAEAFRGSNLRVINFKEKIFESIGSKKYEEARKLTGQVLHTIHDFYAHSNWVEMGFLNAINSKIGTENFFSQPVAKLDDPACRNNCELVKINCSSLFKRLLKFVNIIGYEPIKCPVKYFKCSNNIILLDKLTSGYSVNQKLENGTRVEKPKNKNKCSHGGVLDSSAFKQARGGINKDSGFYVFSPHANLHLSAANLAIDHTEYFFDQLRLRFGDFIFSEFLSLNISSSFSNTMNRLFKFC